jgi:putative radical SAM enzyme (TIGR03279 family)
VEKEHVISRIVPDSIAEELGVEPGDVLLSVNGCEIGDVFDYHYFTNEEYLTVSIRKADGEEWELEIEKEYEENLGIAFENGLMDDYKSCQNKCIFCFIDQMPPGMRDTLYFKDDDSRLSFLQGNYVTLTNMKEHDLERIIAYKLAPINISVQTTNPELRCKMLNNRFAGDALSKLDRLYEAGIPMNGQIVLCKGINDGQELERSITDLMQYMPVMESVSVVPVGLSRFREGLFPLEPFTKEDARKVLEMIHHFQEICMQKCGIHFVHASDEWYLLAEEELPQEDSYDGYIQLENGVGMLRLLRTEFAEALKEAQKEICKGGAAQIQQETCKDGTAPAEDDKEAASAGGLITIATGLLAAPAIGELAQKFMEVFPKIEIQVIPIVNHFFGEQITVSGLLTGQDIIEQLKDKHLGNRLLLPCNLLRSGEEVFLDDVTLAQAENALQVKIDIVKSSGQDLVSSLLSD